jgi:hypothetical protein
VTKADRIADDFRLSKIGARAASNDWRSPLLPKAVGAVCWLVADAKTTLQACAAWHKHHRSFIMRPNPTLSDGFRIDCC